MRYNGRAMLKKTLLALLLGLTMPASAVRPGDTETQAPQEEDARALPVDDEEETAVETVKLGGEDRLEVHQGVEPGDADDPTQAAVDSSGDFGLSGSEGTRTGPVMPPPGLTEDDMAVQDPSRETYATTRRNARTMSLTVPGPRGMVTDRMGRVMATSEVAYQPAIDFGQLTDESEANILSIAHRVTDEYTRRGLKMSELSDEKILAHYRDRRWLPLPVGPTVRGTALPQKVRDAVAAVPHAKLVPNYIRLYPNKTTACHILGYTGIKAKLPTGPINHNDPIFENHEGRAGLELKFNKQLTGRPGVWRLMFDENGKKILDELQIKPKAGGTVVTTLNLEWQKAAEEALYKNTHHRGAFVLIDVHTGEILVLATAPNFDPNVFIPKISEEDYKKLREDPATPLVSRAFAGVYPPASTFKTITVAAALRYGIVKESTHIFCPSSMLIGGYRFVNHSRFEGSINCVTALAISNNPYMYQVTATMEPAVGAVRLCDTARRFGYGLPTGIPLPEKAGLVPDEHWMNRNYGRGFKKGDEANISIGQGPLLATPLQVAHAFSGIANGRYLPKLHLVKQVLDSDGNVVYQFQPSAQNSLKDFGEALVTVRKGTKAVVNGGSGRGAQLGYVSNAGKTGTAQWGPPSEDRRLAWFAGYVPADAPRFAYVALYEGNKGERISGGRMAAAIVRAFFNRVKPSMQEALKAEPILPGGARDEVAEEVTEEEAEQAAALQRAKEESARRAREGARVRSERSGWDETRSRD